MIFKRNKRNEPVTDQGQSPAAAAGACCSEALAADSAKRRLRVMAVCGSGLGSSFLVHMNLEKAFAACGAQNVEVDHTDVGSLTAGVADVVFTARDLEETVAGILSTDENTRLIVLQNIIDAEETQQKVQALVNELGLG